MAGYSDTPLPRKLGIKDDACVAVLDAPDGFDRALAPLPPGVSLHDRARGRFDVVVAFCRRSADVARRFAQLSRVLDPDGGLWIAWPKRASGLETDVTEGVVRATGLAAGLVDNKVCAIDERWSGLRFVYRTSDRAAVRRARGG
jgi:hypothetical protein